MTSANGLPYAFRQTVQWRKSARSDRHGRRSAKRRRGRRNPGSSSLSASRHHDRDRVVGCRVDVDEEVATPIARRKRSNRPGVWSNRKASRSSSTASAPPLNSRCAPISTKRRFRSCLRASGSSTPRLTIPGRCRSSRFTQPKPPSTPVNTLQTQPQAKVAILYQNDDLGHSYLKGFVDGLGPEHQGMIVRRCSSTC